MLILSDSRKSERFMSDCQGQLPLREQQAKVSNFVELHQNCVLQALSIILVKKNPFMLLYDEEVNIKKINGIMHFFGFIFSNTIVDQWSVSKKIVNGDGQRIAKPSKIHRCQWLSWKKTIPSHRSPKLTIDQLYFRN